MGAGSDPHHRAVSRRSADAIESPWDSRPATCTGVRNCYFTRGTVVYPATQGINWRARCSYLCCRLAGSGRPRHDRRRRTSTAFRNSISLRLLDAFHRRDAVAPRRRDARIALPRRPKATWWRTHQITAESNAWRGRRVAIFMDQVHLCRAPPIWRGEQFLAHESILGSTERTYDP